MLELMPLFIGLYMSFLITFYDLRSSWNCVFVPIYFFETCGAALLILGSGPAPLGDVMKFDGEYNYGPSLSSYLKSNGARLMFLYPAFFGPEGSEICDILF